MQLKAALLTSHPHCCRAERRFQANRSFQHPRRRLPNRNQIPPCCWYFLCIAFLALGGGLAYVLLFRNKKLHDEIPPEAPDGSAPYEDEDYDYEEAPAEKEHAPSFLPNPYPASENRRLLPGMPEGTAIIPSRTLSPPTTWGDDVYDDSFSIDALSGEFLGDVVWAFPKPSVSETRRRWLPLRSGCLIRMISKP